jgi:hypothetical protein
VKRRGGRPLKRTERWYALLALIYVTADELRRTGTDTSEWEWEFKKMTDTPGRTTGKTITANLVNLAPSTVTNALGEAAKRGFFTRERPSRSKKFPRPRRPNEAGGRLTMAGWDALGPVSNKWDRKFGPSWRIAENPIGQVVPREEARTALMILVDELHSEEDHAQARGH